MAVNVVRFRRDGSDAWGVVEGGGRPRSVAELDLDCSTTGAFVTAAARAVALGGLGAHRTGRSVSLDEIDVLSPVTDDADLICQAINYRSHMRECGFDPKTSPFNVFFAKASSSLAAPTTEIVCPAGVAYLDYEVEIGLVLGSRVVGPVDIAAENLADHVVAIVALNDVSARDVQLAETQFYRAKSYRTFTPTGPHLTLVDGSDLARFDELRLRLWVNGELRQESTAADMIHRPAETLTELSSVQNWRPGDLVATGTPGGCALRVPRWPLRVAALAMSPARRFDAVRSAAAKNPRRLRPGDVVEASIATDDGAIDLGRQRCLVVAQHDRPGT